MTDRRTVKRLVAWTEVEYRLAQIVSCRLGYQEGDRPNVARAARTCLLKRATPEERQQALEFVGGG